MQDLDQAIRERAYHLWIASGCPDGNADTHWIEAQRDLLATSFELPAAPGSAKPKNSAKPKKKPASTETTTRNRSRRKAA